MHHSTTLPRRHTFKVSRHFATHPDVIAAGNAAVGAWAIAGAWSAAHMTLGHIPEDAELFDTRTARKLEAAGLIERDGDGWLLTHGNNDVRDLYRLQVNTYRAKIPDALRQQVYDRDGHRCVECGATDRLSLDHIHPWSLGGEDTLENLRCLCVPCNARKGARVA